MKQRPNESYLDFLCRKARNRVAKSRKTCLSKGIAIHWPDYPNS